MRVIHGEYSTDDFAELVSGSNLEIKVAASHLSGILSEQGKSLSRLKHPALIPPLGPLLETRAWHNFCTAIKDAYNRNTAYQFESVERHNASDFASPMTHIETLDCPRSKQLTYVGDVEKITIEVSPESIAREKAKAAAASKTCVSPSRYAQSSSVLSLLSASTEKRRDSKNVMQQAKTRSLYPPWKNQLRCRRQRRGGIESLG